MFQAPKSIKELLKEVNTKYYLPAIQREFVWTENQILSLFDSLLKGFPIGSFLFWNVNKQNIKEFKFYQFIQSYKENDIHNNIAKLDTKEEIIAILDGQQRITSLLIGLKGSYTQRDQEKKLYISLSSKYNMQEVDDIENIYKLKFMNQNEYKGVKEDEFWFLVSDVLDMSISDMTNYSIKNKLTSLGIDILSKLYDLVNSRIINYYLETSDDIDKVLNIFVRINSGGTHLCYSDLLLSIATANWKNTNAREEINELLEDINNISESFKVTKDFILKSALFLLNRDIKFKVANFTNEAMRDVEKNWDKNYQLVDLSKSNKPYFEQIDYQDYLNKNFFDENINLQDKIKLFENREKNMIITLKKKLKV